MRCYIIEGSINKQYIIMSTNEYWHNKDVQGIDFCDKKLNKRMATLMNSFLIFLAKVHKS